MRRMKTPITIPLLVLLAGFSISTLAEKDPSWSIKNITDVTCEQVPTLQFPDGLTAEDVDVDLRLVDEWWYYSRISRYGLNSFSLLLRDKPINSNGEARKACLKNKLLSAPEDGQRKEKVRGFEKKIRITLLCLLGRHTETEKEFDNIDIEIDT